MKASPNPHASFPRQAIVLAAGLGTRLRPLTHVIPKPGLPVGGVPILLFNLFLLKEVGIHRITINLHHRPEPLLSLLGTGQKLGLSLQFSLEKKILGTAGGIAQALQKMARRPTFVLNGDILTDLDLKAMHQIHSRSGARATLACVPTDRAKVRDFVEYDVRGKIHRIAGEPRKPHDTGRLQKGIFSGAHLLDPQLFRSFPKGAFGCVIRQIYQPALAAGTLLKAYPHGGSWWDLGNLSELKRVDQSLWSGQAPDSIERMWQRVYSWAGNLFTRRSAKGF